MNNTAEELKDTLNDIERDAYDGVSLGDMFTKAYVLADELGESIDKLSEENAKLRELATDACTVLRSHFDEKWFDGTVFAERMRECGIEVPND